MRVSTRRAGTYAVVAFLLGALVGGIFSAIATDSGADEDDVRELRRDLASEERGREQAEDRSRELERSLRRTRARFEELAADPMRIGARGFEPLIALEGVGRMFYRCAGSGMKLAFVEDQMSATTHVSYSLPGLPPLQRTLQPGHRILTPPITESSSWSIVQSTEPKTVTGTVEVGPPAGACYLAPTTQATIASRSHDKSVTQ